MFQVIRHIYDLKPYIDGFSEFCISEKEDFDMVFYNVQKPTTFEYNAMMRRECRGIAFNKFGGIIGRPYHKFFNIGEKEETRVSKIDFSQKHVLMEKLDGSMVFPVIVNGKIILCTKRGVSEVAKQAQKFIERSDNHKYINLIKNLNSKRLTPIFEWCSPENRIVIKHDEPRLILTGIRQWIYGFYFHYENMKSVAESHHIPYVRAYDSSLNNNSIMKFLKKAKHEEDKEGYVIRFENGGDMFKIKNEWYLSIHNARDIITNDRKITKAIIDDSIDDLKGLVMADDVAYIEKYETKFWHARSQYLAKVLNYKNYIVSNIGEPTKNNMPRLASYINLRFRNAPIMRNLLFIALREHDIQARFNIMLENALTKDIRFTEFRRQIDL